MKNTVMKDRPVEIIQHEDCVEYVMQVGKQIAHVRIHGEIGYTPELERATREFMQRRLRGKSAGAGAAREGKA